MAEVIAVVGAVVSTIQLVDYVTKFAGRLNHFVKSVDGAPESYRELSLQLPLFIEALKRTQFHIDNGHYEPLTSTMLAALIEDSSGQIRKVEQLLERVTICEEDTKVTKYHKVMYSLKKEKVASRLQQRLSGHIEKLLLFQSSVASSHIISKVTAIQTALSNFQDEAIRLSQFRPLENSTEQGNGSKSLIKYGSTREFRAYQGRKNHHVSSTSINLSRLGILWALQLSLTFSWGSKGYSITPCLQVQRLVKHTSPGFETLWRCQTGQIDVTSAIKALFCLFNEGKASPHDVDPYGRGWLEIILYSHLPSDPEISLIFAKTLIECGSQSDTSFSLLSLCAMWRGLGPHLTLLQTLISLGYDLSTDVCSIPRGYLSYRKSNFKLWTSFDTTPDPFFLKFLEKCSRNTYGVWGQTHLMDVVLSGSMAEIHSALQCPRSWNGRNVLGQSAIHLAVLRSAGLSLLLGVYPDLEVQDHAGMTPLEYAAAYGCTESVILLLEAGANPIFIDKDGAQWFAFLDQARALKQWNLISRTMLYYKTSENFSVEIVEQGLDYLVSRYHQDPRRDGAEELKILLGLGVNPNFVMSNGNSFLHDARNDEEVEVLFNAGYNSIDIRNTQGKTALMSALERDYGPHRSIMLRGANVNIRDRFGISPLHIACSKIQSGIDFGYHNLSMVLQDYSDRFNTIASLLSRGADPTARDNCRCPCSPEGCSPTSHLLLSGKKNDPQGHIWALEWLLLLKEYHKEETTRMVLLDLIRAAYFHQLGMTHVCCRRNLYCIEPMDDNEIDEIIDEEREFSLELENVVQHAQRSIDDCLIEESWLRALLNCYASKQEQQEMAWSCVRWKGRGTYHWNQYGQSPPWQSTLNTLDPTNLQSPKFFDGSRYYIEESSDKFRKEGGPRPVIKIPSWKLYCALVEYVSNHPNSLDHPSRMYSERYRSRKEWASKQTEIMRKSLRPDVCL